MKQFKPPVKKYYLGRAIHGAPIFEPWGYVGSIIRVRNLSKLPVPIVRRAKNWTLFGNRYFVTIGKPFAIKRISLGWKDKYGTPRFEWCPQFHIFLFGLQLCIWWVAPDGDNDKYYEMKLWTDKYCNGDIDQAKDTWGWIDIDTNESTWKEEYIINT